MPVTGSARASRVKEISTRGPAADAFAATFCAADEGPAARCADSAAPAATARISATVRLRRCIMVRYASAMRLTFGILLLMGTIGFTGQRRGAAPAASQAPTF